MALDQVKATASGHPSLDAWSNLINEIAPKFAVPPNLVKAHMEYESGGDPKIIGSSGRGLGLMQIDYNTFQADGKWVYAGQYGLCTNPFDPHSNITIACRDFIAPNISAFGDNVAAVIAAYNAGIEAVRLALARGSDISHVTTDPHYVANVGVAYHWFCTEAHKVLGK